MAFTSPTHVVRAFYQALLELETEGGVAARYQRYLQNQQTLSKGMQQLGFELVLGEECLQSPIITTFLYPTAEKFSFQSFYGNAKKSGYVIYPGKVTDLNCFRIGNIGEVYIQDIEEVSCCNCELLRKPPKPSCNSIIFIKLRIHHDNQQHTNSGCGFLTGLVQQ